jgi:hypothetical protein
LLALTSSSLPRLSGLVFVLTFSLPLPFLLLVPLLLLPLLPPPLLLLWL